MLVWLFVELVIDMAAFLSGVVLDTSYASRAHEHAKRAPALRGYGIRVTIMDIWAELKI